MVKLNSKTKVLFLQDMRMFRKGQITTLPVHCQLRNSHFEDAMYYPDHKDSYNGQFVRQHEIGKVFQILPDEGFESEEAKKLLTIGYR